MAAPGTNSTEESTAAEDEAKLQEIEAVCSQMRKTLGPAAAGLQEAEGQAADLRRKLQMAKPLGRQLQEANNRQLRAEQAFLKAHKELDKIDSQLARLDTRRQEVVIRGQAIVVQIEEAKAEVAALAAQAQRAAQGGQGGLSLNASQGGSSRLSEADTVAVAANKAEMCRSAGHLLEQLPPDHPQRRFAAELLERLLLMPGFGGGEGSQAAANTPVGATGWAPEAAACGHGNRQLDAVAAGLGAGAVCAVLGWDSERGRGPKRAFKEVDGEDGGLGRGGACFDDGLEPADDACDDGDLQEQLAAAALAFRVEPPR